MTAVSKTDFSGGF